MSVPKREYSKLKGVLIKDSIKSIKESHKIDKDKINNLINERNKINDSRNKGNKIDNINLNTLICERKEEKEAKVGEQVRYFEFGALFSFNDICRKLELLQKEQERGNSYFNYNNDYSNTNNDSDTYTPELTVLNINKVVNGKVGKNK